LSADSIRVLLGADACLLRRFGDFVAVLIRAGDKICFASCHAGIARQNVGDDRGVGVPDVRGCVDVINRGW